MITGKQNMRCGLIGEKLSHSFSPQIHGELADYSYELFEMSESEVEGFLESDRYDCINVTIPYKKTVIPYLDEISDEAKRIGSVNTVVKTENGKKCGYNTDYYGFKYAVDQSGIEIKDKNVLILGTGGASLTAKTVSEDLGAKKITFVSRSGEINYQNVYEKCPDTDVVINCTPVGMYPKSNGESPVTLEKFKRCQGVLDMIFNPAKTKLLLDAERLGIPFANGLSMLVAQAKKACEFFLGEKIADSEIGRINALIANQTGNIILVGMPGSGKTTVGKLLAEMTGRKFIDTDEMITSSKGRSPSEIITADGEKIFRQIEHKEVKNAGKMSGMIISTGGGVVTRRENFDPLRQNGKIFFIHRSIDKLPTADRPLSQQNKLDEMYRARLPLYREICNFEVSNDATPEKCAAEILQKYGKA
ncbi:MAG: hypothetical protein IKL66_04500 [Clostridia bacterium]|nr:hypothetical protein [Clostridia bacterium]